MESYHANVSHDVYCIYWTSPGVWHATGRQSHKCAYNPLPEGCLRRQVIYGLLYAVAVTASAVSADVTAPLVEEVGEDSDFALTQAMPFLASK